MVILLQGQAEIKADDIYLVSRGTYEIIGEQAFISHTPRSATAIARGMVKALELSRELVTQLMQDSAFCQNLLRMVSSKLAEATAERAYRYRNEELLFTEFRAHLSPEVTERLLATGRSYGEPRYINAIILFSDIRGFTQQSSGMSPEEIAEQLSLYLDAIVEVIHRHEGLVDKFIGDAVMAIWGFAPSDKDLATQAFACAQEMIEVATRHMFGGASIAIGVGLNAGKVFIGNIGGEGKRQFTVLGTPVNLAARYESESKNLGAPIVMGQDFVERLSIEAQVNLTLHPDRLIKGADNQTLYTLGAAETAE